MSEDQTPWSQRIIHAFGYKQKLPDVTPILFFRTQELSCLGRILTSGRLTILFQGQFTENFGAVN